jgi:hypothetical protein
MLTCGIRKKEKGSRHVLLAPTKRFSSFKKRSYPTTYSLSAIGWSKKDERHALRVTSDCVCIAFALSLHYPLSGSHVVACTNTFVSPLVHNAALHFQTQSSPSHTNAISIRKEEQQNGTACLKPERSGTVCLKPERSKTRQARCLITRQVRARMHTHAHTCTQTHGTSTRPPISCTVAPAGVSTECGGALQTWRGRHVFDGMCAVVGQCMQWEGFEMDAVSKAAKRARP